MVRSYSRVLLALLVVPVAGFADVVINEVHYNPTDMETNLVTQVDGSRREFVELFNPGPDAVDLSGYAFTAGIRYTFPLGTSLDAGMYLVVALTPGHLDWIIRGLDALGPYEGKLSNAGERITLSRMDGTEVDSFKYDDVAPWPQSPDRYGSSLERIAWDLPSDDFHSWRGSIVEGGTPGGANSVAGTPPRPVVTAMQFDPAHPTSRDEVTVRIGFDGASQIGSAVLRWERIKNQENAEDQNVFQTPMQKIAGVSQDATYEGRIPAQDSQQFVRCNVQLQLRGGGTLRLPHLAEPAPFFSCFIYDGEISSVFPLLWLIQEQESLLPDEPHSYSAAVILMRDALFPSVFDGIGIDRKLRFLKGAEFRGERTLNLPYDSMENYCREFLAYWLMHAMDIPAPRTEWFRVIRFEAYSPRRPNEAGFQHRQQLALQQVNERFLEMNGRDPDGYLFKREKVSWEVHAREDEGVKAIEDLVQALQTEEPETRREVMERELDLDEFISYSAASILLSNWDGFHNNHWMYRPPKENGRWEIIPWDLDQTWGFAGGEWYDYQIPTDFPKNGNASRENPSISRGPGPISGQIHKDEAFHQAYLERMRYELDRTFSEEVLFEKIAETESLLLEDLTLLGEQTRQSVSSLRESVTETHLRIREYIRLRRAYLDENLPELTQVENWELY